MTEAASVILAAGASSRMGSPKMSLRVGRRTLLEWAVDLFAPLGSVVVVVSPDTAPLAAEMALASVHLAVNPDPARGMLSSVQVGLSCVRPGVSRVFVHPVDCLLTDRSVLSILMARPQSEAQAWVPTFEGAPGHPVMLSAAAVRRVLSEPSDASFGACVEGFSPAGVSVGTGEILRNLNVPEQFEEVAVRWREER